MTRDIYDLIWGRKFNYREGFSKITYNGRQGYFAVGRTKYGDGEYHDEESDHIYRVDAGVIGIVSKSLCDKDEPDFHWITSISPVEMEWVDGDFIIEYNDKFGSKAIYIDTAEDSSDDDT